jgi:hypothetical protein
LTVLSGEMRELAVSTEAPATAAVALGDGTSLSRDWCTEPENSRKISGHFFEKKNSAKFSGEMDRPKDGVRRDIKLTLRARAVARWTEAAILFAFWLIRFRL